LTPSGRDDYPRSPARDRPGAAVSWRRRRWSLAALAVVVEIAAFVAWRLWLRRRGR
jgi:hypothetical protein